MRIIILIILFIVPIQGIWAQKSHIVSLEKPVQLNVQDFYVADVIDNRLNKGSIGVVQKGMFNRQVNATFPEPFGEYVKTYLKNLIPDNEGAVPLTIRINKLVISERTSSFSELGLADAELEFLREDNGKIRSYGSFSSTVEGKGADVTGKHDKRITEALKNCISQFSVSGWQEKEPVPVENLSEKKENSNISFRTSGFKKGLYRNFNDLITNSPVADKEFDLHQISSGKTERFVVREKGRKKKIKKLFGFSDGENIYLNASRYTQATYFIKSHLIGRYIYFEDKFVPAGAQAAGFAFGAIGGAVAAASAKNRGIILDTTTGITTVLTKKEMEELLSKEPDLLNVFNASNKDTEAQKLIIEKLNERKDMN